MKPRALAKLLVAYGLLVVALGLAVHGWFSLGAPKERRVVESWWKRGVRVQRFVRVAGDEAGRSAPPPGAWPAEEEITGEGPLLLAGDLFTLGLVPGRDGVKATLDGRVAYATVDDLLAVQAYDRAHLWVEASFGWGTDREAVLRLLAAELGTDPSTLRARGSFRRVRFERRPSRWPSPSLPGAPPRARPERVQAKDLTVELLRDAAWEAAQHLARGVDEGGGFRYLVNAPTNQTIPDYNWPRHSGATLYLAQAANLFGDAPLAAAARRAAERLRQGMLRDCGANKCIGLETGNVEIGSSALALLAFVEIERGATTATGANLGPTIAALAAFLRSQQRADGEMMHIYDRDARRPVDVQFLYYTGEAALALARAHLVTHDDRDLEAAKRTLARLSGSGWSFFGSRYYFGEEHWTCQAVAELWSRAPDEEALAFCSRWHEFQRRLQLDDGETPFDADGAFGFGPLVSPRVTPASSRGEAAGALYEVLVRRELAGQTVDPRELSLVRSEFERALAFVLRNQFAPGPAHLFAEPVAARGGVPGSPVDWQLRIDYAQHAGGMFLRWLEVDSLVRRGTAP